MFFQEKHYPSFTQLPPNQYPYQRAGTVSLLKLPVLMRINTSGISCIAVMFTMADISLTKLDCDVAYCV